jgi:hypothetical protein
VRRNSHGKALPRNRQVLRRVVTHLNSRAAEPPAGGARPKLETFHHAGQEHRAQSLPQTRSGGTLLKKTMWMWAGTARRLLPRCSPRERRAWLVAGYGPPTGYPQDFP